MNQIEKFLYTIQLIQEKFEKIYDQSNSIELKIILTHLNDSLNELNYELVKRGEDIKKQEDLSFDSWEIFIINEIGKFFQTLN